MFSEELLLNMGKDRRKEASLQHVCDISFVRIVCDFFPFPFFEIVEAWG